MVTTEVMQICAICDEEKDSYITIQGAFLCRGCERELISTDPMDSNYSFFIEKLKNILFIKAS